MSHTRTTTFTRTHARHIASKIVADLRQMNHFYGQPSETDIDKYFEEVTELLAAGYLRTFEDGFETSDGRRVVTVRYEIRSDGTLTDDRSGRVYPGADISSATHFNFVTYTDSFLNMSKADRDAFKATLPVQRVSQAERSDGNGYWVSDRSYASGGVGAQRGVFRPL
jgi:Bacterial HORMA domain family 1